MSSYTPGDRLHGFTVEAVTPLDDLAATLVRLTHDRTGARYLHLASADDNNLFAVGFRTPPADSTGAPHILEHTVLCGSERFPVRDPFFAMLKRSLATFMNAMTADDWTLYPFATQNPADFRNLMAVYLDAVFFPLLREGDFSQEGHRLEFADPADPASPLTVKGVVYNEMKGYLTDPHSLLSTRLAEALYPTSPYGRNAGGEPAHIPDLTWEGLRAFHAAYYHPSNAYFFSYGDQPLDAHLAFVAGSALDRFERRAVDSSVAAEPSFDSPLVVTRGYPVAPGEPTADRSFVQVGWVTCPVTDEMRRVGMQLLSVLLLGHPGAPLYKALLDAKLGANLAPGAGYDPSNRQTTFAAGLQGTAPDAGSAVESVVLGTLERCAREGFASERIEAALHQMEFAHREVRGDHYPYALGLFERVIGPWLHGADPAGPLRLTERLDAVRAAAPEGFFQQLIRSELLDNPHRVTLTLAPDPEVGRRDRAAEAARLDEIAGSLDEAGRERIVVGARELAAAQESPGDFSALPTLELVDIPRIERPVPSTESAVARRPVRWFEQPTNGIAYFTAHLDLGGLSAQQVGLLPLFGAVLGKVAAAGRSYPEVGERISASTGGIGAGVALFEAPGDPDGFEGVLQVDGRALYRNQGALFEILGEVFGRSEFDDLDRLHTLVGQIHTSLSNALPSQGHRFAARAAAARLRATARLREGWGGVTYLRKVEALARGAVGGVGALAEAFAILQDTVFTRARIRCAVTAEVGGFEAAQAGLGAFLDSLPRGDDGGTNLLAPAAAEGPARVGLAASVPVNFVARVYPCVSFDHPDAPGLLALAKLLRAGYLHREIREKGGAYGGMAGYTPEAGLFSLLSYRDPHLTRTVGVFDDAARWAASGDFDDTDVKEAVLGVFADLDRPPSPGARGAREFGNLRQGLTPELRQRVRDGVLSITRRGLADLAERYLVAGRSQSALAALASADALAKANTELGDEPFAIEPVSMGDGEP